MPPGVYINNTVEKEKVRKQWVNFSKSVLETEPEGTVFSLLTLPSSEAQELREYEDKGLLAFKENETVLEDGTKSLTLTKGKLVCYENRTTSYSLLRNKLVGARVCPQDIYDEIIHSRCRGFPHTAINLDFDGSLKNSIKEIDRFFDNLFILQATSQKNFCIFITFPKTNLIDLGSYKNQFIEIITDNINDPSNSIFKDNFSNQIGDITNMSLEDMYKIGISKHIIKSASHKKYKIVKVKFFEYGDENGPRNRMISLLFHFEYKQNFVHNDYYNELDYCFKPIQDLSAQS
jgi:hypothetical protein